MERNWPMGVSKRNEELKKRFCLCMLSVFFWGLAAYGYCFLHNSFSHDSLSEFNGALGSNAWKIELGRILVPVYKMVFRTNLTLPWLCGGLTLLWIGLAVFLTAEMFEQKNPWAVFLTAGVFTVNLTVSATAVTYVHDLDGNLFGMLCAAAAVFLWQKSRFGFLPGMVLIAMCLGFYQSYLAVGIVLALMLCLKWLLDGERFGEVFRRGLAAIGMLVGGGVLYAVALLLVWKLTGTAPASGGTNSLDMLLTLTPRSLLRLIVEAYLDGAGRLFRVVTPYPQPLTGAVTVVLLLLSVGLFALELRGKGRWETLLSLALAALLPLGMNMIYVLSSGLVHDLMVYGIWLAYLPALLLAFRGGEGNRAMGAVRRVCCLLVGFVLFANVQTANALSLKKDMEQDAFLSYMTRVVHTMENCEGYVPGQIPVVFVGQPPETTIPGFEKYARVTGADQSAVTGLAEDYRARAYFQYVLNNPAVIPGSDVFSRMASDPRVQAMPSYPQNGSIALVDGVLVVKLSP